MDYVVNAGEMQYADENTISCFGMPQLVLMERAALLAGDFIKQKWPALFSENAHILIAAGNGNNGGDGVALARLFYLQGYNVSVLMDGDAAKYTEALKTQRNILEKYRQEQERRTDLNDRRKLCIIYDEAWQALKEQHQDSYDLVVDALFGVGLSRSVEGIYREKIEWLNGLSGKKAALDIPSGISARDGRVLGVSFLADITVTFGFLKAGMLLYPGKEFCGEIKIAEIGITAESFLGKAPAGRTLAGTKKAWEEWKDTFLKRRDNSHKGSYGKVLLFAGSKGAPGAALLAGEAVLRSGAGMLQLASSPENRELVLAKLPEAMYQETAEMTEWKRLLDWCDAVVIGPGIGQEKQTENHMEKILTLVSESGLQKPVLLDADGLNLTASSERLFRLISRYTASGGVVIMTPHMAELARLLHCEIRKLQEDRMGKMEQYVRESGVILVGKDAATVVCYADEAGTFHYYINQTGNSGMATAGSGDVLSGISGAFAALWAVRRREHGADHSAGKEASAKSAYFEAVCGAVYLHGLAGDAAAEKFGKTSMKAGDMIAAFPELLS